MAVTAGGWKAFRVRWVKGDGHYQSGTMADVYNILSDIRTGVLATGIWEDDPDFEDPMSGVSGPVQLDGTNLKWTHGIFFRNVVSGAKLCLSYTYSGSTFQGAIRGRSNAIGNSNYFGGLCCSVIPPGGGSFDVSKAKVRGFVPDKGTPIFGPFAVATSATGAIDSAVKGLIASTSSGWCEYDFAFKDDVVGVFLRTSYATSGGVAKGAYFGHILDDDLCPRPGYEEDLPAANYGAVFLNNGNQVSAELTFSTATAANCGFYTNLENYLPYRLNTSINGGGVMYRRAEMRTMTDTQYNSLVDGSWIGPGASGFVVPSMNFTQETASSSVGAFGNVCVVAAADKADVAGRTGTGATSDPNIGCIRSDIILVGKYNVWARGQTFDYGRYVYVGQGTIVGWDPSIGFGLFDN
ncbi:MAG: hypothetical protein MJ058_04260 [Akkermansia sp.]|nr:hypothetical protein [Akkermansia sp.]